MVARDETRGSVTRSYFFVCRAFGGAMSQFAEEANGINQLISTKLVWLVDAVRLDGWRDTRFPMGLLEDIDGLLPEHQVQVTYANYHGSNLTLMTVAELRQHVEACGRDEELRELDCQTGGHVVVDRQPTECRCMTCRRTRKAERRARRADRRYEMPG